MKIIRLIIVATLIMPTISFAGEKELKNALSKAQYMLRQANAEKVALQKEVRETQLAFDDYKKKVEKQRMKESKGNKAKEQRLNAKLDSYKEHYETLRNDFGALRSKHALLEKEKENIRGYLELEKKKFNLCVANNQKLFEVNKEILGEYENKGFFSVLKQSEPALGLSRVQIENLVQQYQYKNEDLLVTDF